jgi:hypothetical protein
MLIALIVLGVICLALTGAVVYMIRIVAAGKVSSTGYEFQAALAGGKRLKSKLKKEVML